jgi:hypothetical protein
MPPRYAYPKHHLRLIAFAEVAAPQSSNPPHTAWIQKYQTPNPIAPFEKTKVNPEPKLKPKIIDEPNI